MSHRLAGRNTPLHQQQEKHDLQLLTDGKLEHQADPWRRTWACIGAACRRHMWMMTTSMVVQCTVRQHRHLECNSLWHVELMEADERISDVVSTSRVEDEPCCGILDWLKMLDMDERQVDQETVAIIQVAEHKGRNGKRYVMISAWLSALSYKQYECQLLSWKSLAAVCLWRFTAACHNLSSLVVVIDAWQCCYADYWPGR